jgi:hypothetical protein
MSRRQRSKATPSAAVRVYCLSQRQWPRALRIAHARYQRDLSDSDRGFWNEVLKLNGAKQ